MVVKYWNFMTDVCEEKSEFTFTVPLPQQFKIGHNKKITFLCFTAAENSFDCNFYLHNDQFVRNNNLYHEIEINGGEDKCLSLGYTLVTSSGKYPHPKTFNINDELEELEFTIRSDVSMRGNYFVIEMKIEYDY